MGSGSGVAEIYYLNTRGIEAGTATGMSLVQYILHKVAVALYGITGFTLLSSASRGTPWYEATGCRWFWDAS